MCDNDPLSKRDEQYPLLKVDSGGGDGITRPHLQSSTIVGTPGWNVTCSKRSWFSRWPEVLSACWMTIILFGISFLIFYALGMSAYRKRQVVVIKCNVTKPASNVYYHHIIPRDSNLPFSLFSEYLSYMASEYPFLNFNVLFLIDDSIQPTGRKTKHSKFLKALTSHFPDFTLTSILDQNNQRQLIEFQRKYQNVNVTIMPLSKYMDTTPLRYRWRIIPINYLSFYARVFSIWMNSGIAFDLVTYNHLYNNRQPIDRRITGLVKQHNNGIDSLKYNDIFKAPEKNPSNYMSNSLIDEVFSNIFTFFYSSMLYSQSYDEKNISDGETLIRTHRNKRDINNVAKSSEEIISNIEVVQNVTGIVDYNEHVHNYSKNDITTSHYGQGTYNATNVTLPQRPILSQELNKTEIRIEMPQIVKYVISLQADDMGPPYDWRQTREVPQFLSINLEGTFLAASSQHHPLLAYLLSVGCQRVDPKYAIEDALLRHCPALYKDDVYCDNIYVI